MFLLIVAAVILFRAVCREVEVIRLRRVITAKFPEVPHLYGDPEDVLKGEGHWHVARIVAIDYLAKQGLDWSMVNRVSNAFSRPWQAKTWHKAPTFGADLIKWLTKA